MAKSNAYLDAGTGTPVREEGLRRQLVALQQRSLADTSRRQYNTTWGQWTAFSRQLGRSPWLPQNDEVAQSLQLVLFAIDRWSAASSNVQPRAISTIHTQVSHVKWFHRVYAGFEPAITPSHATAFAGMRRLSPVSVPRTPVSSTMLEWVAENINYESPQHRLFLGAALLGFFYLLRSSEYLAVKGGRHRYALEVRDVQVYEATGRPARTIARASYAVINLRGSKTDQQGLNTARSLSRSGHARVCPVLGVAMLLELAERHGLQSRDALCSFSRARMLKAEELSKVLKAAAAGIGTDPRRVSCHSLRSGGATALIANGVDSTTIKLHGRWKSSAFQRYTQYSSKVGEPLAALMAGNSN